METVIACVQQAPSETSGGDQVLELRDIAATASSYLEAVEVVEAKVPDGWRILYVRSAGASTDEPLRGAAPQAPQAAPSE